MNLTNLSIVVVCFLGSLLLVLFLKREKSNKQSQLDKLSTQYEIIEVDSCEYIKWVGYRDSFTYTHKANCKYCALRAKRQ